MSSQRLRRVTLAGDVSGEYVVLKERSDGSLLVAPDARSPGAPAGRPAGHARNPLARLLWRPEETSANVSEVLAQWQVQLHEDEVVLEFLMVEIDGRPAFVAITDTRFVSVSVGARGAPDTHAYPLSAASRVKLVRRGRGYKLRVSWHDAEILIGGVGKDVLVRVNALLAAHRLP